MILLLSSPSYSADLILKHQHQPVNYAFLDNINQPPPVDKSWFPKMPSFTFTINNEFLKDITVISNFTFTDFRLNVSYTYDQFCDYANKILIDIGEVTTSFTLRK